jgi:hypothetical protein
MSRNKNAISVISSIQFLQVKFSSVFSLTEVEGMHAVGSKCQGKELQHLIKAPSVE